MQVLNPETPKPDSLKLSTFNRKWVVVGSSMRKP